MSAREIDEYRTLAAEHRYEVAPTKGSRFLTTVAPVASEAEAEAFVARVRAEFTDATHNCWAWRLGPDAARFRSSDDGEPGGSAGRPILQQLEGHALTDVAAVVTRWYGGTKLGVGGLMRAYGGAAGKTLDRARVRTVVVTRAVELVHPYESTSAIQALLSAWKLAPRESEYGEDVRLVLDVPRRDLERFARELTDRSAGSARLEPAG